MNLLHVNSYYIGSKIYKNLYEKLDSNCISQNVFVPVKNEDEKQNNYIDLKNGEIYYKNTFNTLDRILYFTKINKSYNSLIVNIEFDNIQLVHAHSLFVNGGIAYKLKKEKNIDYIVAVRSTDVKTFFKKMIHLRKRGINILKKAKKIIFISPAYKKLLLNKYIPKNLNISIDKKSVVIPNGINDFWLENSYKNTKINKKDINLVYAGKFIKRKQIDKSIQAVKKLNNKGYNVKLNIIGKGKREKEIKTKISRNPELFNLYGYMSQEELLKIYRNSDIFIMPSYHETFGLVYIEAMSQGLPIIYSKNEGVDGYFDIRSVGYAVDPNDINEITNKIQLIVKKYSRLSKNAVKEAQRFSWHKVSNQYINLYKKLI